MKRKKLSKNTLYELSKFYQGKSDDMMALAISLGAIGFVLVLPAAIVMDMAGVPDSSIEDWKWYPMVPSLICGWISLYFNFRSWLADPYKNI